MALQVHGFTPWFGAEVSGLVPAKTLDEATCRDLQELMADREVLVFRDLAIDRYFQSYLCEIFRVRGCPDPAVVAAQAEQQNRLYVSNNREGATAPFGELLFHSDCPHLPCPPDILSLWAEEVVPPVAPTRFASVTYAWDTLPDDLRVQVEGLVAEQTNLVQTRGTAGRRLLVAIRPERTRTTPIAAINPRSGRTVLHVSRLVTKRIVGLDPDEGEALLAKLFAHIEQPANVWTHEWRDGDLVVWDNLSVQHARPDVAEDGPVRTLRKTAVPAMPAEDADARIYRAVTA